MGSAGLVALVALLVVPVLALLGLLGHLDRPARWLAGPFGRRRRRHAMRPSSLPIEQLAADLRRLADGLENARRIDAPAKMERLTAAALAYDWVLLSAARTLEVPAPRDAPLQAIDRLHTEAALAARGLDW